MAFLVYLTTHCYEILLNNFSNVNPMYKQATATANKFNLETFDCVALPGPQIDGWRIMHAKRTKVMLHSNDKWSFQFERNFSSTKHKLNAVVETDASPAEWKNEAKTNGFSCGSHFNWISINGRLWSANCIYFKLNMLRSRQTVSTREYGKWEKSQVSMLCNLIYSAMQISVQICWILCWWILLFVGW